MFNARQRYIISHIHFISLIYLLNLLWMAKESNVLAKSIKFISLAHPFKWHWVRQRFSQPLPKQELVCSTGHTINWGFVYDCIKANFLKCWLKNCFFRGSNFEFGVADHQAYCPHCLIKSQKYFIFTLSLLISY